MKGFFVIFTLILSATASPVQDDENEFSDIPNVETSYLDKLLEEQRYEEFSYYMGIENSSLVRPRQDDGTVDLMMHEGLEFGDMLLPSRHTEEARQGLRFDRYPQRRWPNRQVPYVISNNFKAESRWRIEDAVTEWNDSVRCLKFVPRGNQNDYVFFFPGNGCWSYLGRIGNRQSISLQDPGCIWMGTMLHEMQHAAGFAHEQNRSDRDKYIRILWNNIPQSWQSQYQKTNPNDYGLQRHYDYYSIMHYGIKAPGTNNDAYEVYDKSIDTSLIGSRDIFSETDINKINDLYC